MAVLYLSANAITLFPFFCDVAGDYSDITPKELTDLNISCRYSRVHPYFYSNLASADSFLQDVVPSSEPINRDEKMVGATKIVTYQSPMLDDVVSILYLVEIPEKGLYVGYSEDK